MDFSATYQRMKHEGYRVSAAELAEVREYLSSDKAQWEPSAHAPILILCHSTEPSASDLALIGRFLSEDADDYTRSGAVNGIWGVWALATPPLIDDLLRIVASTLDDGRFDTSIAAIGCALKLMHRTKDYRISVAMNRVLERLYEAVQQDRESAEELFVNACMKTYNSWAESRQMRPSYSSTISRAFLVYRERSTYLLDAVN